jgi:hypothetical protein
MVIVYTVGEISNNNIKIHKEQGGKMAIIFQPCSLYYFDVIFLISPTVYTIAIFQPCSVYILMLGEIRKIKSKYTQNKVGR